MRVSLRRDRLLRGAVLACELRRGRMTSRLAALQAGMQDFGTIFPRLVYSRAETESQSKTKKSHVILEGVYTERPMILTLNFIPIGEDCQTFFF